MPIFVLYLLIVAVQSPDPGLQSAVLDIRPLQIHEGGYAAIICTHSITIDGLCVLPFKLWINETGYLVRNQLDNLDNYSHNLSQHDTLNYVTCKFTTTLSTVTLTDAGTRYQCEYRSLYPLYHFFSNTLMLEISNPATQASTLSSMLQSHDQTFIYDSTKPVQTKTGNPDSFKESIMRSSIRASGPPEQSPDHGPPSSGQDGTLIIVSSAAAAVGGLLLVVVTLIAVLMACILVCVLRSKSRSLVRTSKDGSSCSTVSGTPQPAAGNDIDMMNNPVYVPMECLHAGNRKEGVSEPGPIYDNL